MCGPIEKCCCCFPAKVGVNFIGGILIIVELGALIYSTVILKINNKSFHEVSDHDLPGYSWYMAGAFLGFFIFLMSNILVIYGSSKNNRYYLIPWLVLYMLTIIGLTIGALVIIVFFTIIFPIPTMALLCLIPIISGLILLYWWMVVNGRFISLGLSEVTSLGAAGPWA